MGHSCTYVVVSVIVLGFVSAEFVPQFKQRPVPGFDGKQEPRARSFSACTRADDLVYCFGGMNRKLFAPGDLFHGYEVVGTGITGTFYLSDLSVYHISTNFFEVDIAPGPFNSTDIPEERFSGSLVYYDNKLYLFGGTSALRDISPVLWIFDTETLQWESQALPEEIQTRYGHTAVVHDDKMFVFGGYWPIPVDPFGENEFFGLTVYDFITETWETLDAISGPPFRASHSAVVYDGSMYIFGGEVAEEVYNEKNDLWKFSFETETWTEIVTSEPIPVIMERHAAAVGSDDSGDFMLIYGGYSRTSIQLFLNEIWKFYFAEQKWVQVPIGFPAALPRFSLSLFPLDDLDALFLVLHGRQYHPQSPFDVVSPGELYVGPPVEIDDDFNSIGDGTDFVLLFPANSPNHALAPVDDCDEVIEESLVSFRFSLIQEVDPNNFVVQQIDIEHLEWQLNKSTVDIGGDNHPQVNLSPDIAGSGVELNFGFTLFQSEQTIDYADTKFSVAPGSDKWTLELNNYVFLREDSTLRIKVTLVPPGDSSGFQEIRSEVISSEAITIYTLSAEEFDFMLTLSDFAIIDGERVKIRSIVDFPQVAFFPATLTAPSVTFEFPQFQNSLLYDPDFGVTFNGARGTKKCSDSEDNLVVVVASVCGGVLLLSALAIVAILLIQKFRLSKDVKSRDMVSFDLDENKREMLVNFNEDD
eukprot:CAMPEP_0174251316 /NCGR_PEP_ID=MMETSP0439-20130205/1169_1 /TAXON_ID=0 /ORGANISM="Stereomyxa ramosa, Strain Chinc5" /LENGTH=697 /DNA_ID=CAMNT_0015331591 /DNA_START=33 /DNA_END=2123 /DNA_ORIENTATION=+